MRTFILCDIAVALALPLGFALLFAPVALTGCKTLDSILTNAPPPTISIQGNNNSVNYGRRK